MHISIKQAAYAAIEDKFRCIHKDREIRQRTISDGRLTYLSQCVECGHASSPIAKKAAMKLYNGRTIPSFDNKLDIKWHARKSQLYLQTYLDLQPELKAEYSTYLSTPEWKAIRGQVIARADGVCEICEKHPAAEVHHLTYVRLGHELLADLMALCSGCHELVHTDLTQ